MRSFYIYIKNISFNLRIYSQLCFFVVDENNQLLIIRLEIST